MISKDKLSVHDQIKNRIKHSDCIDPYDGGWC